MQSEEIRTLEEEHYKGLPRMSKREWLNIFPEAREYLEEDRETASVFFNALKIIIKFQLEEINKVDDEFSRWFWSEFLEITDGNLLDIYDKRLRTINSYLEDPDNRRISEEAIMQAKQARWEDIIKPVKRYREGHFISSCPFHNERIPSFLVKNNFGYCFGCNWSGDTIKFLMETENINFIEAVKRLT